MTDFETVARWMTAYIHAWESNEPGDIRALFTPGAMYYTAPFAPPRAGHEEIVSGWLEDLDEPGDWHFTWSTTAQDGDLAFVEGRTVYNGNRHGSTRAYRNLWVIRFAADGRASSFTEWYMREGPAGSEVGSGSLDLV
jgi:ketosteroid isomerase-like protein